MAEKLEQRREMRRARRYRKAPRRPKRFDNRRRPEGWIAPSQKSKVDFRTKVVDELRKLYPVSRFAVEDVKFNHYRKRWGKYFSTVEIGKAAFYKHLRKLGDLGLYTGVQTAEWRGKLSLPKNSRKNSLIWDTHAVDAIAIGCADLGCENPYPPEFRVWKCFEYTHRQLHRLEPDKGGVRRRYGGSWSIPPFRKGDVVSWRDRLARVGGFMGDGVSLHSFGLRNKRFTQTAKIEECTRLYKRCRKPTPFMGGMNAPEGFWVRMAVGELGCEPTNTDCILHGNKKTSYSTSSPSAVISTTAFSSSVRRHTKLRGRHYGRDSSSR